MLAPKIGLSPKYDVPPVLSPVADGGELFSGGLSILPNVEEDWLARPRMQRRKRRHGAVGRADVLPVSDKLVVFFDKRSDVLNTIGESDLMKDRIGAEIHQSAD